MERSVHIDLILLLASLAAASPVMLLADSAPSPANAGTSTETLVVEDFAAPLDERWTWQREDPGGWRLEDGKLSIRTRGLLWGRENSQRNVLLLKALDSPRAPMAAEITVDAGLAMTHAYEHGGLIWYVDDDHWVTLTQLNHVQDGTQKIMLVHEVGGRGQAQMAKAVPYTASAVRLRLEYRGGELTGFYRRPDAEEWRGLGSIPFDQRGATPRFGIVAGQGLDEHWHWVEFDDFRVEKEVAAAE